MIQRPRSIPNIEGCKVKSMSQFFDCSAPAEALAGVRAAKQAIAAGELAVIPTDTVYGVAADAFNPAAVQRLLDAKGRGRTSPPPVLIPGVPTLTALASEVVAPLQKLADECWPGGLTIITTANPALNWDLGETAGTVALRMPADPLALEVLRETGPLAVSSANLTGEPAALSAAQAQEMLGESVAVYLENGAVNGDGRPSTIIDATGLTAEGGNITILRLGVLPLQRLQQVLPQVTVSLAPGLQL